MTIQIGYLQIFRRLIVLKKLIGRFLSIAMAVGLAFNTVCTSASRNFITDLFEAKDVEMVVEAEDFKGSGFSVTEDAEASGGKALVSGDGTVSYTFTLDTAVERLTIYAYHKSSDIAKALTWMSLEGFEHYALYDYEYGVYHSTRFFYHQASAGNYTINLTGVRTGQYIDKFVIKYDRVLPTEGETTSAATTQSTETQIDLSKYRAGNPELEAMDIAEIKEETPGYFVAECEDATFSNHTGTVANSRDASGGRVYISTSQEDNKDAVDGETELRFKFYVSKSANYRVWLRYYTPDSYHKDAWMSFDGIDWKECGDGSKSTEYKWKNFFNVNLREGWHTLEIKHRTTGWLMDKFIITSDSSFTPKGFGSIEGEDTAAADLAAAKLIESRRLNPKVKSNNFRMRADADFEFIVGDVMVPSTNIAAALGIFQQNMGDYFLLMRDRQYMKFYDGSNRIISSGKVINASKATYSLPEADDILMISLRAAQETFGFDYEYDPSENTIHIFDSYTEPYVRTATDEELIVETSKKTIYYTIPYDNPNAKVEVYLKRTMHDSEGVRAMNWDNLNKLANGGNTYKMMDQYSVHGVNVWYKAQTPIYVDGAFRGVQHVSEDEPHHVRVVITDNGTQDEFMRLSPSVKGWESKMTPEEYKYNTNGELLLVPTFENIGYYIDYVNDNSSCTITYRKVGDKQWKPVFDPMNDTRTHQFRGSIAFLKQDTEYEVKAVITEGDRVVKESIANVHTWKDNPPIAKTVKLKDIYSGKGDLTLLNLKGTEDGWIKVDGEGMTVDVGKEFFEAVTISNCEYLIFENVKVRGGTDMGIVLDQYCHDVRIVNCDIAEWGTGSVQDPNFGPYYRVGNSTNHRAGIQLVSSVNAVVERCYIHDSDSNTNPWTALNYRKVHPMGSTAVMLWGQRGTVIRYNDIVGSDLHRWNDALEGTNNGTIGPGSTGSDSDIYGNLLMFTNDDSMELDGAQMNVRVYQNKIEQTYVGISTAPMTIGPSYIYRNQIVTCGDKVDNAGVVMKTGGWKEGWPKIYFFNNTFRNQGGILYNSDHGGSTEWHGTTRNTIFAGLASGKYGGNARTLENTYADERDDYDYDLICGSRYVIPTGSEQHSIHAIPQFVNETTGDFRLVEGSPGWRAGAPVGSFTATDTPHMGAFAGDKYDANFLPARPIDMSADIYTLNLKPGEEGTVKITVGDVETGHTYSILKNRDFDFIEILNENKEAVALKPNSVIELKLKSHTAGRATVLVRLDNGYSVPVVIYCN